MDVPFRTHVTEECTHGSGAGRDSTSSNLRLVVRGPRQAEARVLCATLSHTTSMCPCRKKKLRSSHRTRSHSQNEIRRELQSIPQTIHIPSGQWPSDQPSVRQGGGEAHAHRPHALREGTIPSCRAFGFPEHSAIFHHVQDQHHDANLRIQQSAWQLVPTWRSLGPLYARRAGLEKGQMGKIFKSFVSSVVLHLGLTLESHGEFKKFYMPRF